MTDPAGLVLTNGRIHSLTEPDEIHGAVAIRDGEIIRVGSSYEIDFLRGARTNVLDLDGAVVLPGFIDAHTHLEQLGRRLVQADLSGTDDIADAIDRLTEERERTDAGWICGYGYDETEWDERRRLTMADLDQVSADRPVVAFREDLHTGSLNSVAFDQFAAEFPEHDVHRENGDPTGVVVEEALNVIHEATTPNATAMRPLIEAARDRAHELGITGVHDFVRNSTAPQVYRALDLADDLGLRVRINYWSDHLDALMELGERTNYGSEFVQTGAIKSFADGSFGGRTAKLSEPYEDGDTGQWVTAPSELAGLIERADANGFQYAVHAIGDVAIETVLERFEGTDDPAVARHRIEHGELLTAELLDAIAQSGVVVSAQPNFLKWAREGGLYEDCLGVDRTGRTNQFRRLLDAGVVLAFGSDCMPMDPLFGVQQAVTAPHERQRLTVTEALRAYTTGGAYAGFAEDRLGTIKAGKRADLVVLDESPWAVPEAAIADIAVTHTIVDGTVVFEQER